MKKILMSIIVVLFAALIAVSLVACNDDPVRNNGNDNASEVSYFNVTFNPNGGLASEEANMSGVAFGSTIPFPKNGLGEDYRPTKNGYTFLYWEWTTNGETREFRFSDGTGTPDVITGHTTIRAHYKADEYTHELKMNKLEYIQNSDGSYSYAISAETYGEDVNLGSPTEGDQVVYKSTFGENSSYTVPVMGEGEDKFCFFYYMTDRKEDGKQVYKKQGGGLTTEVSEAATDAESQPVKELMPVRFTAWREDGKTTVTSTSRYTDAFGYKGLELYMMFESNLPKITVKYEGIADSYSKEYALNATVPEADGSAATEAYKAVMTEGADYEFDYWYYELEVKGTDDKVTITENEFVFEPTPKEEGEEEDTNDTGSAKLPTNLRDATGNKGDFTPVTLLLKARRLRVINLTSAGDFDSKIRNELNGYIETEKAVNDRLAEDPDAEIAPEEQEILRKLKELLSAKITVTGNINIQNPVGVFDADHPFVGTITMTGDYTIDIVINDTSADQTEYSLFGYVNGEISGLKVSASVSINPTNRVKIGVIALVNGGKISDCTVTLTSVAFGGESALFGGIAATNNGDANDSQKGRIEHCTVTANDLIVTAKDLTFGAIVGEGLSNTTISTCSSTIGIQSIESGTGLLQIGGISGNNGGAIELCNSTFTFPDSITISGELALGGIAGKSVGGIQTSWAKLGVDAQDDTQNVLMVSFGGGRLSVGGIVGISESYINYCHSEVNIDIHAAKADDASAAVYVGGLVGNNGGGGRYPSSTSSGSYSANNVGAIVSSYAIGKISVDVQEGQKNTVVYAGGLSGLQLESRLTNSFTMLSVNVSNEGSNHVGYLFGGMNKLDSKFDQSKNILRLYYIDENDGHGLILNGEAFKLDQVTDENGDVQSTPSEWSTHFGEIVAASDLNSSFLVADDRLNFDVERPGSTSSKRLYYWDVPSDVTEGPLLPELVDNTSIAE